MSQATRRKGFDATLDGLDLPLAVTPDRPVRVETVSPEATRVDTGQSPEDFVSEFGQTFSRARFAGGEGLGFAHREDSEPDRFWRSEAVDVGLPNPGDRHAIRLLRDVGSIQSIGFGGPTSLATDGESLWGIVGDSINVRRTDDPLADSPSFVDDDPTGGSENVSDLTILGSEVYASVDVAGADQSADGVYKRDGPSSWTQWSTLSDPERVWAVKQRIVAGARSSSSGEELYEVRSGTDSVLITTLSPGAEWLDVVDAGSHILAAADDGYVYAFTADDGADMALVAQTKIPSESPISLATVGDVVLIGTRRSAGTLGLEAVARLWTAQLGSNGNLGNLSLVRQWGKGDPPSANISSMISDGESVFIGLTYELENGNHWSGLWRYHLVTGGRVEHLKGLESAGANSTQDIAIIGQRLFFTVRGEHLYRQSVDTYRSTGWLMTPAADFFTALDKSWLRIDVEADLPSGTSVEVSYATDLDAMDDSTSGLWTSAGIIDPTSTSHTLNIAGTQSRFLAVMVTLSSNSAQDETPRVYSTSVTANVVGEEVAVELPVNVSDRHERFGRRPVRRKANTGRALWKSLLGKRGQSVQLDLWRHDLTVNGVVDSVAAPTPGLTPRGSPTMYANVVVRGKVA